MMRLDTDTGTFARFISKRFKVKCHNVKRMIPNTQLVEPNTVFVPFDSDQRK